MAIASRVDKGTGKTTLATRGEFAARLDLVHAGPTQIVVRYELTGPADAPLLVVAGGISSGRHVLASSADRSNGWWQCQAAALGNFRLLSIDWVGADGELDKPIDPSDQARAIIVTLDELGISNTAAFVGASYGAMVGMHLAALAPERIGALLSISGADRAHPFATAQRAMQRQAIELGEKLGSPEDGVALARKLAILTYRTPEEFAERFAEPITLEQGRVRAPAEPYLDHMGERHRARMSAAAYRRLSESIDLHRIDPATITVPATFVAVSSDQLVPVADVEALAKATADGRCISISSLYGHDAFLKEEGAVALIIETFLNSLEQR